MLQYNNLPHKTRFPEAGLFGKKKGMEMFVRMPPGQQPLTQS